jgi:hypothetical protein
MNGECGVLVMLLGYVIVEVQGSNSTASKAFSGISVALIALYSSVPFIELGILIRSKYVIKRVV